MRVTRVTRLKTYIANLDKRIEITNKKDAANIDFLNKKMNAYLVKMNIVGSARMFFYMLLYASVVASFIGNMATDEAGAFISKFASPIIRLGSILGTTLALGYILLFGRFVNMYWEDVRTIATNMIAIYTKYDTKGKGIVEEEDSEGLVRWSY